MKDLLKKMSKVLMLIPFIMGSAGYFLTGNSITDSLYASFALYFTNPISDSYNVWIELARWTAPLTTITIVLSLFENVWKNILWWFDCLSGDSVAVYTDTDIRIVFDKKIKAFYSGRNVKSAAKSHIIMLDSDKESLKFYDENKNKLTGKSVYIGLQEIDYGLVKEMTEVNFFDINGAISRLLWKQIKLWEEQKENVSIAILGKGVLAENILSYGLLLNLYSKNQRIVYHMIGNDSFQIKHTQLPLMNNDKIVFHLENDSDSWDVIRKANIIIVAEEVSVAMLQLLAVNGRNAQIYYYSHKLGDVGNYLQVVNLFPFGHDTEIYTDDNIRQEKLVEEAKNLNKKYADKYNSEADWNKLNGFLKWSNISSADFEYVLNCLLEHNHDLDEDIAAELEHIRWCRFHYLNYWTYGKPLNGKNKDVDKRIHTCLRPYCDLSQEDKDKDKSVINEVKQKRETK